MRIFFVLAVAALAAFAARPAVAQGWSVRDDGKGPLAQVCDGAGQCFGMGCADGGVLRSWLDLPGTRLAGHEVALRVDGREAGALSVTAVDEVATLYVANFDPEADAGLVAALKRGVGLRLVLPASDGEIELALSLAGSSRALGEVLGRCPLPVLPVADPGAKVLGEITAQCAALGGEVGVEPGFRRVEDLDGDGKPDLVIDHAAAACSRRASLGCGPGGCTVSFWLKRDEGYLRAFSGMIRGYRAGPGGVLALDTHGAACGGAAGRACVQLYDLTGAEPLLVETLVGEAAMAALEPSGVATLAPAPVAGRVSVATSDTVSDAVVETVPEPTPDPNLTPNPALEWLGDGGPLPVAASVSAE